MGKYTEQGQKPPHKVADDDPRAVALLKEEHQRFRVLFDEAEQAEGKDLVRIAREICMRLEVHMTIEEEILYPALKETVSEEEVDEGIVEHATGKGIVSELEQLDGSEELFGTKVHVLGEVTIHHIDEEDEELFEDAKKAHEAGKIDLDEIGHRLEVRRKDLYRHLERSGDEGKTCEAEANEVQTVNVE